MQSNVSSAVRTVLANTIVTIQILRTGPCQEVNVRGEFRLVDARADVAAAASGGATTVRVYPNGVAGLFVDYRRTRVASLDKDYH